jgi:hypothetical protein
MSTQFQALVRAVIDSSVANDWGTAVTEWEVTDVDEDPDGRGICVCGQPNLVQLFTIENQRNRAVLQPIGSHMAAAAIPNQPAILGDMGSEYPVSD